jgi:hypothetical protein
MLIGALLLLVETMAPARAQDVYADHALLQSDPVVSIDPSSTEVDVGDTVTVDVYIENVTELAVAEMYVVFDPDFLEVADADPYTDGVQIEIGPFLGTDVTVEENTVDQDIGEIFFSQVASDTVDGSGILASITFEGKAAGTSDVFIDADELYLEDGTGEFITASIEDGVITVVSEVTTSPTAESSPTPDSTSTPASTSTSTPAPAATSTPANTSTPRPTATSAIESRVLQIWPDRSVGVASGLLEGATSHADTRVFPFGTFSPSPGGTVQARTYLHFPIDALPLGTEVKQATLYVYVDSISGFGEATFGAYRVLAPWNETGWSSTPATWPLLLSSPIAITAVSFEAEEAAFSEDPSVPKLAFITGQNSPLPTPTSSSVLPTPTLPTSTATPTSTPTRTPDPAATSAATSSPTSTPTTSPSSSTATATPSSFGGNVELEPTEGRWIMWDVTALLRAWLAEEVADHGLALAAASDPDVGPEAVGDLLLARLFTVDDPNTMPYIVADILIHPVTPTPLPTPVPILPPAGGSGGWGGTVVLFTGAVLLLLGLALTVRRISLNR